MQWKMVLCLLTGGLWLVTPVWAGNYVASNGVVTDQRSGLVWQQQADSKTRSWFGAIDYCEGLSLANKADWRLPNVKELQSISDNRRTPAIDQVFTGDADAFGYWSSTPHESYSASAWAILYVGNGQVNHSSKTTNLYVRCVRGGQ